MPELPEVETVVRSIAPRLAGARILAARLLRADILSPAGFPLSPALAGRTIRSISRRAKRILVTLDDNNRFYIHLGMSGQLILAPSSLPHPPHTHFILEFASPSAPGAPRPASEDVELRFRDPRRFGGIFWLGDAPDDNPALGPEPLSLSAAGLATRLFRARRPIKAALLDQRLIAGLGNIYADEALHAAGIHPLHLASRLSKDQIAALSRAVKTVLRRAIRHKGSTLRDFVDADHREGYFQKLHRVYARADKPCLKCSSPIQRIILSGRSTHFCPQCQPLPSRSSRARIPRKRTASSSKR